MNIIEKLIALLMVALIAIGSFMIKVLLWLLKAFVSIFVIYLAQMIAQVLLKRIFREA